MNTNKFLIGGIVAGVLYFGLGYLVWGVLLKSFMETNMGTATGVMKAMGEFEWWALIVGNLFSGLTLSYVLNKAGANSASSGAAVGATIGLLISAGFNFTMFGVSNISNLTGSLGDIGANTVVAAIIGAVTPTSAAGCRSWACGASLATSTSTARSWCRSLRRRAKSPKCMAAR